MLLRKSMELIKKYGNCPECGWKVIVDVRKDEDDD